MSVPRSKRSIPKLKPLLDANMLIKHTILITSNEKVFKLCYKALTDDIVHCSEKIFTKAWEANNIRINTLEDWKWKYHLQTEAINECKNMLALINIAYGIFHLRGQKVDYWASLIIQTSNSLSEWRKKDKNRYFNFYK